MKRSRFVTVLALAFAGFCAVFFAFELKEFVDLKRRNSDTEKRMKGLAARRDRLNSLSDAAGKNGASDPRVERIIREKLGLIKEGEKVFIFRR